MQNTNTNVDHDLNWNNRHGTNKRIFNRQKQNCGCLWVIQQSHYLLTRRHGEFWYLFQANNCDTRYTSFIFLFVQVLSGQMHQKRGLGDRATEREGTTKNHRIHTEFTLTIFVVLRFEVIYLNCRRVGCSDLSRRCNWKWFWRR